MTGEGAGREEALLEIAERVSDIMEKACKKCRIIIAQGEVCPICGSSDLTNKWSGYITVINVEKSEIAKKLSIKVNGRYAVSINS